MAVGGGMGGGCVPPNGGEFAKCEPAETEIISVSGVEIDEPASAVSQATLANAEECETKTGSNVMGQISFVDKQFLYRLVCNLISLSSCCKK